LLQLSPSANISSPLPATQREERLRAREGCWSFLVFVDGRKGGRGKVGTKTNAGAMRVFFFLSIFFLRLGHKGKIGRKPEEMGKKRSRKKEEKENWQKMEKGKNKGGRGEEKKVRKENVKTGRRKIWRKEMSRRGRKGRHKDSVGGKREERMSGQRMERSARRIV
jgi:hypothetical protein